MSTKQIRQIDRQIGVLLREARLGWGYSLKEIAVLLGITYQQVQKYETGANRISVSRLLDIAEVLKITPESLLVRPHGQPIDESSRPEHRAAKIARQIEDEQVLTRWLELGQSLGSNPMKQQSTPADQ